MTTIPFISVQLVHMQGPLKGEIQELADNEIRIGRHPDCQVLFPKDLVTLSRVHARIVREGNRFQLIDQSTNGTFVNGQKITEIYLKDGDVVMFSEGGPKMSFLTQVGDRSASPAPPESPEPRTAAVQSPPVQPQPPFALPPAPKGPPPLKPAPVFTPAAAQAPPQTPAAGSAPVKVPFAIQYGPALKSFHTLPIVIGSGPGCDFAVLHPAVSDRHAQIYYAQDRYWIKDLTGSDSIIINGRPIPVQVPLEPDMQLSLTLHGPTFRFIGGGRLAEVENPLHDIPKPAPPPPQPAPSKDEKSDKLGQKAGALFKKFFSQ